MSLTIEEIRGLGDPQKSYRWRVVMPIIDKSQAPKKSKGRDFLASTPNIRNAVSGAANTLKSVTGYDLNLDLAFNISNYAEEVQGLPFPGVDRESIYEGGRQTHFPSTELLAPFTISFYQDESSRVQNYFLYWKGKIVNQDGTKNYPSEYKHTIVVKLLDGLNNVVFDYKLLDCFPTQTAPYTLNNTSGRLVWVQEFSADRVEIEESSASSNQSNLQNKLKNTSLDKLQRSAKFSNREGTFIDDLRNKNI